MTIESRILGVSNKAFNNALKAKLRDPTRPIRVLDFMTVHEREILFYTSLGDSAYEMYLQNRDDLQWREFNNV